MSTSILDSFGDVPAVDFAALQSVDGRRWIDGLPGLVDELCREWGLTVDVGEIRHGYHAVVAPVTHGDARCVLKLAWPADSIGAEALALRTWNGAGAVRLLQADPARAVLLLERLDPARSLAELPVVVAAAEAATLLREMSVPAPAGIRSSHEDIGGIARSMRSRRTLLGGRQARLVETALSILESFDPDGATTLVHGDLHYENILHGERRPWLAIDPKPLIGHPERAVAELLFTRVDELRDEGEIRDVLSAVVDAADLDAGRAARWAFVRTIDYWLWGLEHGLTIDPPRCRRVIDALARLVP